MFGERCKHGDPGGKLLWYRMQAREELILLAFCKGLKGIDVDWGETGILSFWCVNACELELLETSATL